MEKMIYNYILESEKISENVKDWSMMLNIAIATQRWFTTQSNSAEVNINDCTKEFIGPMQDDAESICSSLNSKAEVKTSWSVESGNKINNVIILSTNEPRDYATWVFDSSGMVNNGLPYIDLSTNGYN